MKDIVERAAIALYSHQAWAMNGYPVWQSLNADVKAAYRAWARDTIAAIEVPTDAMNRCGHDAGWHGAIDGCRDAEAERAASLFGRMLLAGLAESEALSPTKNGHAQRRPNLLS